MSDVTLHVNMILLTVEDRLLIKSSLTEKGCVVEKRPNNYVIIIWEGWAKFLSQREGHGATCRSFGFAIYYFISKL